MALRAVMDSIPAEANVLFAGDAVGYYDEPNYVCDFLRDRANFAIAGNHDLYVTGKLPYKMANEAKYRIQWTREKLSAKNYQWLDELPLQQVLRTEKTFHLGISSETVELNSLILAHGVPGNCERYVYPDTPIDFVCAPGTLVILGHTHHPMLRRTGFGLVVNPGSIGQPRDRNPSSALAHIDLLEGTIYLRRVPYDHSEYAIYLRDRNFDEESIRILTRTN